MSYFSQKKKQKRINILLITSLSLIAVVLFLGLFFSNSPLSDFIDGIRFQLYIFTIAIMIYALFCRKTSFAIIGLVLLLFNYTIISSSTNLFFNVLVKGTETLKLRYHETSNSFPELYSAEDIKIRRKGTIKLSPTYEAFFMSFRHYNRRFSVVSVNLKDIKDKEIKGVYDNLIEFVLLQDDPVILVGDFGITSWSPIFKNFLQKTALEVKNRIIMTDGSHFFSPFSAPTINLLAYKNIGIRSINVFSAKKKSPLHIDFELEYN